MSYEKWIQGVGTVERGMEGTGKYVLIRLGGGIHSRCLCHLLRSRVEFMAQTVGTAQC
jgi:hypothetical protein